MKIIVCIGVILCFTGLAWAAPQGNDERDVELLNGFLQSLNARNGKLTTVLLLLKIYFYEHNILIMSFIVTGIMHTGYNCYNSSTNCAGPSFLTYTWFDCCFIHQCRARGLSYRRVRGRSCQSW